MPSEAAILDELKKKGTEQNRKIYARHGMASDRLYGVSIADLKVIAKNIKGDQALACALYESGIMEAMYLAGIVADGAMLSTDTLQRWAKNAAGLQMISEYTIPWLAVDHPRARELALEWMSSKEPNIAASGWCTYAGLLSLRPDDQLDLKENRGSYGPHSKRNRCRSQSVKLTMNNFVIAVGTYVKPLLKPAKAIAKQLGQVKVNIGETDCKVAPRYGFH